MSQHESAQWRLMRLPSTGSGQGLEVLDLGKGAPVLFIHAGVFTDWFAPVAMQPALAACRRILVRRAGYETPDVDSRDSAVAAAEAASADLVPVDVPADLVGHAYHQAAVLDALGTGPVRVCGHSLGALIGLQLALDRPDLVKDLVLLEPAPGGSLAAADDGPLAGRLLGPAIEATVNGDWDLAFDTFLHAVGGGQPRDVVRNALGPAGLRRAVAQTRSLLTDTPAVAAWQFGSAEAERIRVPVLLVGGELSQQSAPFAPPTVERLQRLLPHVRTVTVPGVTHLMPLQDPAAIARLVAEHWDEQTS